MVAIKANRIYIMFGGATLAGVVYLLTTMLQTSLGFPLDDAWIHQVFARNLALDGQFAYNPGQIVAGSTSPLWSIFLAPAYWFGSDFYRLWAYGLGLIFLALTASEVFKLYLALFSSDVKQQNLREAWVAVIFTMFEWHLVWAATSGMETLLFTFLSLWLVRLWLQTERFSSDTQNWRGYLGLGLVGGLLTLVRPEGLVLLGLIGLEQGRRWFFSNSRRVWQTLAGKWLGLGLGWLVLVTPYLLFDYISSGSPLPTTFYAKASGYASNLSLRSTVQFLADATGEVVLRSPLLFLGILSVGYLMVWLVQPHIRANAGKVDWRLLSWPVVLVVLYAWRLPVTYQHARYLMPLYPFLILYAIWAAARFRDYLRVVHLPRLAGVIPLLLALVLVATWYYGALTYQSDVEIINDEQVQIGQWLQSNTPPTAIIATHDIGAIAFFSHRRIIDTAGLVSPEFIPIVHDETAILQKVQEEGANYFALMSSWHPNLYQLFSSQSRQVFQPTQKYLEQFGPSNLMHVFKLK